VTEQAGRLVSRYVPQQDQATIMRLLGYQPQPVSMPSERPARLTALATNRRRGAYPRPVRLARMALTGD
jgi:arginine decarboxylase